MLHLSGLPGTPHGGVALQEIMDRTCGEAETLVSAGFEMLMVENMGDRPYLLGGVGPEIVSCMTAVCCEVRRSFPQVPLGVQVLAGANEAALAVAQGSGAGFIRAEGFVFSSVADEGLMGEAAAGPLLRYRRRIGAEHIAVLCDIKKKHSSHAITADLSIAETARAALFCGADGIIVTGAATGEAASTRDIAEAAGAVDLPLLIGSGVTPELVPEYMEYAAGLIVGSYLKETGDWSGALDGARARALVDSVRSARG